MSKITVYRNTEDLIEDDRLDCVDICLPTHLHSEVAVMALRARKHVLCEKPMGRDLKECDAMIKAAKKHKRKLMIGQCLRFWPEYEILADYVRKKKLGKLLALTCFRGGGTPIWSHNNWILQKDKSGGALLDLHIHDIDMINHIVGTPESVSAIGMRVIKGSGIEILSSNYRFPGGPVVNATCNWLLNGDFGFTMSYLATFQKGNMFFDSSRNPSLRVNPDKGKSFAPELPPGDGFVREIDYFLRAIARNQAIKTVKPESARESIRIGLAELKSIEEKRPVKLKEIGKKL